jgi:1,4-dihydroxy-6-naphthoate synthase
MHRLRTLTIAYTPDSDDAFYYFALETGQLTLPGFRLVFHRAPVSALNRAAQGGIYPITAISSVVYPSIADRYAILSVGTSVGRDYGPVLVSRHFRHIDELKGRRVGVPGAATTGAFLLRWLCPEAVPIKRPFDRIGEAVACGDLDAGVMIHEELLYYPRLGLHCVLDLGAQWCRQNRLPLPVGLNVIRRDLGQPTMELLCDLIRQSLRHSIDHPDAALDWVSQFGRGAEGQCTDRFVAMFANEDSLRMPGDVRRALPLLFSQVVRLGLAPRLPSLDVVEGMPVPQRLAQLA